MRQSPLYLGILLRNVYNSSKVYCTGWILIKFLSADSFSSALLGVSSREEGEGEELFDKFFVAFVFQLKPGILALNQVVSLEASTWTQN